MSHKIFFSWQSDTPTEWGRNFVERALTKAAANLVRDLTVEESIRGPGLAIDKDTKGVSGTPPIVETIFKKIDGALAYVADLTFVGKRHDGRPTPNPNVLVEYGWALKSLGHPRIITLMNTAYGVPSDDSLPFNMKHLRWPIQYHLPDGSDDRAKKQVRETLVGLFGNAIKAILESEEFRASFPKSPEIAKFAEMKPIDGPGRFRKRNESIGVVESPFGIGGAREITLADGPAMWLRVMPDKKPGREWTISELRDNLNAGGSTLMPLGSFSSWDYVRAQDGFGYVSTVYKEGDPVHAALLAFKTGELWSVYSGPLSLMPGEMPYLEPMFVDRFGRYLHFLRVGLKVAPPYRWVAGMEGLKGKRLWKSLSSAPSYIDPMTGPCLTDTISERGILHDGEKWQLALNPFFRKLYDACGWERPDRFDAALLAQFPD